MNVRAARMTALGLGVVSFGLAASALADPPDRVARLAYSSGAVSFAPGGQDQWSQAELNRPLVPGDRLWTDASGRDEVQIGSAAVRMQGDTLVNVINLDDRVVQLQLSQGRLNVRVSELAPDGVFEIDTPTFALTLREPGDYRIDVDPDGTAGTVIVHSGVAQADGQGASWTIGAGQAYRFDGPDLRNYQLLALAPPDEFDRWAAARDRRAEQSVSARYVPRELVGYDDLDDNGSWRNVDGYGDVWTPTHVAAGWTPYRDGHWSWVEPWGWTWVDDAPWGFAVSHYGRWANMGGSWCWVPGPARARPVYAPALVAFVGAAALLGAARGGVAWFPLGPREVYRPAYHVSQNYFNNVNISNTHLNRTQVVNVYNSRTSNINYINRGVNGAVVAVPVATFAQSRPVGRAAVPLARQSLDRAPILQGAGIRPQRGAVAVPAGRAPSAALASRPVFARTAPPRQIASFGGQPAARPAPQVKLLNTVAPARPIATAGPAGRGAVPVKPNGQPAGRQEAQRPQAVLQAPQPQHAQERRAEPGVPVVAPGVPAAPSQPRVPTAAQPPARGAAPVAPVQPGRPGVEAVEHGPAQGAGQERRAVHNPQMRPAPAGEAQADAQQRAQAPAQHLPAPVPQVQAQPQRLEIPRPAPVPQVQAQPQRLEIPRPAPVPQVQAQPQRLEIPRPAPVPQVQAQPQRMETPRPAPAPQVQAQPQRMEMPRPAPAPQVEAQPQRMETPRPAPAPQAQAQPQRMETPRPAPVQREERAPQPPAPHPEVQRPAPPPHLEAPRPEARQEAPRPQARPAAPAHAEPKNEAKPDEHK